MKKLIVGSEVQKAVFTKVLLGEIATGFWKDARPADHADFWKNVEVEVGDDLGVSGFDIPRNYNFVNPEFFKRAEQALLDVAIAINPDITSKQLKKQLISLNQIIGSRLKSVGGIVVKLPRGRKQQLQNSAPVTKTTLTTSVRKVAATFVESNVAATI